MSELNRYYEILGLKPGASLAEVKQAYRALAKLWHPDRFAHDLRLKQRAEEKIKSLNEAYQQLKNYEPGTRRQATDRTQVSSKTARAEAYYDRGAENVKAGRYKAALEDLSIAIKLQPRYAQAYRYRGFVNSLLGFELGAEADLRKAAELGLGHRTATPRSPQAPESSDRSEPAASPQSAPTPESSPLWTCRQILTGHTDAVTTIALSCDGKLLASGSLDGTVQLWNLRTEKRIGTFADHTAAVRTIALSADGQMLASGSDDCAVKLWHLRSGSLLRTITGHFDAVTAVMISPDRQTLLSGGLDGALKLWHLNDGSLLRQFSEQSAAIGTAAISADGRKLVTCDRDQAIKLWDLPTGQLQRTLTWNASRTTPIAFCPDGVWLAFVSADQTVKLWNLQTDTLSHTFDRAAASVRSLAFSPIGNCWHWDVPIKRCSFGGCGLASCNRC